MSDLTEEEREELELDAEMDRMDEAMFGCGPVHDHFPQGNEMRWSDHFLNGRESGAGPDINEHTTAELLSQGYTKAEVAAALRAEADRVENE